MAKAGELFRTNQVLVISNGIHARIGSLTAGLDRFAPWRTIDGVKEQDEARPELEVLIRRVFAPERFLDIICDFVTFEVEDAHWCSPASRSFAARAAHPLLTDRSNIIERIQLRALLLAEFQPQLREARRVMDGNRRVVGDGLGHVVGIDDLAKDSLGVAVLLGDRGSCEPDEGSLGQRLAHILGKADLLAHAVLAPTKSFLSPYWVRCASSAMTAEELAEGDDDAVEREKGKLSNFIEAVGAPDRIARCRSRTSVEKVPTRDTGKPHGPPGGASGHGRPPRWRFLDSKCPLRENLKDGFRGIALLGPMPGLQVGENPCLLSGRRCRLLPELVPAAAQLREAAPLHRYEQIELSRHQTVQQGSDSRGNTHGHGHLPPN